MLKPSLTRRQFIAGSAAALVVQPVHALWPEDAALRMVGPTFTPVSLDPALGRDTRTNDLVRHVFRGLTSWDATGETVPELAASIETPDAGLTWDVVVRDDVTFSNGRAVEAEDVAWSLARALRPEFAAVGMGASFLGDIAGAQDVMSGSVDTLSGITVQDARHMRITLAQPSFTLPMRLASVPASVLDRTQATSDPAWWQTAASSGPYQLANAGDPNVLDLTADRPYRGTMPVVRRATVLLGESARNPENLFQGGNVDLVTDALPQFGALLQDPALHLPPSTVSVSEKFSLSFIAFGGSVAPLDDVHIRRALQALWDGPRFVAATYGESATVATGIVPPNVAGRCWSADIPAYSVERALDEIAQSRYRTAENVPPITIYGGDIEPAETLRDVALATTGLVIDAVRVGWTDFLDGLGSRSWGAYTLSWDLDYPDPEALLRMLWHSESLDNYANYRNATVDRHLDDAWTASTNEARLDAYEKAQQALIDDAAVIPIANPLRYTLAVQGLTVPMSPMGLTGLEQIT